MNYLLLYANEHGVDVYVIDEDETFEDVFDGLLKKYGDTPDTTRAYALWTTKEGKFEAEEVHVD